MSFGAKIRILRESKGMSRTCCDEILNVMHGTVSNWENGYAEPEEELLPVIAGFFGIRIRDLTGDTPLAS